MLTIIMKYYKEYYSNYTELVLLLLFATTKSSVDYVYLILKEIFYRKITYE